MHQQEAQGLVPPRWSYHEEQLRQQYLQEQQAAQQAAEAAAADRAAEAAATRAAAESAGKGLTFEIHHDFSCNLKLEICK